MYIVLWIPFTAVVPKVKSQSHPDTKQQNAVSGSRTYKLHLLLATLNIPLNLIFFYIKAPE